VKPPDKRKPGLGTRADATTKTYRQPESYRIDPTEILRRLGFYRDRARTIRLSDARLTIKLTALVDLMRAVRAEPDRFLREHGEAVVYAQASVLLEADKDLAQSRDPIAIAARALRAEGYETCPRCRQRLSDVTDWAFWSAVKRAEVERLQALDGAA
jgi:hypothetical protein